MADLRRLQHAVAGDHHERIALVFVDEPDPARLDEDDLEADLVEVHVVGDGTALGDGDVRGDVGTAPTVGEQVAVSHPRPSDTGFTRVV